MQEKSIVKQNVLKFLKDKGMNTSVFYKKTNITRGILSQNNGMNEANVTKFLECFPSVNANWLITGKGNMLNKRPRTSTRDAKEPLLGYENAVEDYEEQEIPLYDTLTASSVVNLFKEPNFLEVIDIVRIPNMPKSDGAISITDDSMYPLIKSGDLVLYKIIHDKQKNILFGNMYLVVVNIEGDEILMVKYIKKGASKEYVTLVSENKNHGDVEIHLDNIIALALIKGNVHFNFTK